MLTFLKQNIIKKKDPKTIYIPDPFLLMMAVRM